MTAAERLLALAGTTGTAGALLLAIGTGATAGEALVDYSGLATGTAAEHLLAEVSTDLLSPARPATFKAPRRTPEAPRPSQTSYVQYEPHVSKKTSPGATAKIAAPAPTLLAGLQGGFVYTDLYLQITATLPAVDQTQMLLDQILLQAEQERLKKLEMLRLEEEFAVAMLMAM